MRAPIVLVPLLFAIVACSAPPQKELDRAQGAIDAALAAGAEQYAPQAFAAATSALQQAHTAVAQRDYRLALTHALDASDRAREAAKGAADGKARARSDAETAINAAASALERLQSRVAADRSRAPKRALDAAVRAQHDAEGALQKARAWVAADNYLAAIAAIKGVENEITAQIRAFDQAVSSRPAKPPRRRS